MLDAVAREPSVSSIPPASEGPYRATATDDLRLVWTGGMAGVTLDSSSGRDVVEADVDDGDLRVLHTDREIRIAQRGSFWERALDAFLYGFDPEPRARVSLHRDWDWNLECRGGISELDARLDDVRLTGLTLRGGVSASSLILGTPRRPTRIRISGGVSRLEIGRPPHVGLRLRIRGGVSDLVFDEMELGGVGGKLALTSADFATEGAFYDVEISGGASDLVLTTTR